MAEQTQVRNGVPVLRLFLNRPYLTTAIVFGVVLFFVSDHWITRDVTRILIGWNGGIVLFLCFAFFFMLKADAEGIKRAAISHDEGGHFILVLTILASVASVGALVAELSDAKGQPGGDARAALAAATVVLSWLFVQIVFAMHYAHVYYLAEESGQLKRGLEFGQDGEPDYWDFFHFSIVMGATSQTADITFSSREMRRIGTLHTLVAFGFNTAILATMINLTANLF
ncbi:MAG TPA: DUF1345 domain-containing protein [Rhizomicrobium sp.]|jgi:uncharacterized membrane protein